MSKGILWHVQTVRTNTILAPDPLVNAVGTFSQFVFQKLFGSRANDRTGQT